MKYRTLLITLLAVLITASHASAFNYIKSQSDYLREVPDATALDYRSAFVRNLIDFIVQRQGITVADWLESRNRAIWCNADPTRRYGRAWDIPATVPGYAGDSNGEEVLPANFKFRNRLYGTNWMFTGYGHCGGTTSFTHFFFLQERDDPDTIGLRWLTLDAQTGRRILTLSYNRRFQLDNGNFFNSRFAVGGPYWQISPDSFSETVNPPVDVFETRLRNEAQELTDHIFTEDGLRIRFAFSGFDAGIQIEPNDRISRIDWMQDVIRGLNLGYGGFRFANGVPTSSRIGFAVTTVRNGPPRLNVGVGFNGFLNRNNIDIDYYVTQTNPTTLTVFDSEDNIIGTAPDARGVVRILRWRL